MHLTDSIKEHVERGVEKISGHFDQVIEVHVILNVDAHRQFAEFNVHANGLRINAKESTNDMYLSVDRALEKVERQVRKHKDRILRHQPRSVREARSYGHDVLQPTVDEDNGESAESRPWHHVILRETFDTKPMSVEEAAFQLELIHEQFLIFTNADTDKLNVIYDRHDGTYGLIEPHA